MLAPAQRGAAAAGLTPQCLQGRALRALPAARHPPSPGATAAARGPPPALGRERSQPQPPPPPRQAGRRSGPPPQLQLLPPLPAAVAQRPGEHAHTAGGGYGVGVRCDAMRAAARIRAQAACHCRVRSRRRCPAHTQVCAPVPHRAQRRHTRRLPVGRVAGEGQQGLIGVGDAQRVCAPAVAACHTLSRQRVLGACALRPAAAAVGARAARGCRWLGAATGLSRQPHLTRGPAPPLAASAHPRQRPVVGQSQLRRQRRRPGGGARGRHMACFLRCCRVLRVAERGVPFPDIACHGHEMQPHLPCGSAIATARWGLLRG